MKFSMIFEAQLEYGTPDAEHATIHDCVAQAAFAEQMGFDGIWAVEHHSLVEYSHMPAPEIFLTAVAARTSRIRVGHGAVCMPFGYNHPVRVAERAAMLDVISNGRLNLGAARGATEQELSLCGVKREDTEVQVREALRMIGAAWRSDTFSWESDLITVHAPEGRPTHTILPRPVQRPHPPLYLACSRPDTVKTAARYGVGAMVLGYDGPEAMGDYHRMFMDERAATGDSELVSPGVVNEEFVALCPTVLAEDGDEGLRLGARAQRFFAEAIQYWAIPGLKPPAHDTDKVDNVAFLRAKAAEVDAANAEAARRGEMPQRDSRYFSGGIWSPEHPFGDAEKAIDYVRRLEAGGVTECMCMIQMGTLTQEQCLETIRIWGEQVMPRFREAGAGHDEAVAATAAP
jgi:alkanesulfonate monooxygenase SsuD/methylene tetrahydromethanopterin reductase-like flavin-dependent oxidoreductase (luciferase family)